MKRMKKEDSAIRTKSLWIWLNKSTSSTEIIKENLKGSEN